MTKKLTIHTGNRAGNHETADASTLMQPVLFHDSATAMMEQYKGNSRRKYSNAEELALTTQVDGKCPLCGSGLFTIKRSKSYKAYELAHIFPLNPTPVEQEELKNEARMHADINHPDNLIPLCLSCHGKFDKPRTAEEYRELSTRKITLIRRSEQQDIQASYQLETDIQLVISGLYTDGATAASDLEYESKNMTQKFDDSMPLPTQQKIKHNVTDYYQYTRKAFLEIERGNPNVTELIYSQVKTYYLNQKKLGLRQPEIFSNIVNWFVYRTRPQTIEAAEIVASFFVQNCEVFE
jgi:HNH endonuclease